MLAIPVEQVAFETLTIANLNPLHRVRLDRLFLPQDHRTALVTK